MTDQTGGVMEFRVGSVLGRSISILLKNIVPFGLVALVLTSPPTIYTWVTANPDELADAGTDWSIWLVNFFGFLLGHLVNAALVYGTVRGLRGRHASLGDCIGGGLAVILPVIGVAFMTWLAVAIPAFVIGFIAVITTMWLSVLEIVIGVIVMIVLCVAIPAAVVERLGVLASLSRSAELTEGFRWQIFAIFLLFSVGTIGVVLFLGTILASVQDSATDTGYILVILLNLALAAFFTALWAVLSAVSYHDLRVVKEGVGTEEIAAVFD